MQLLCEERYTTLLIGVESMEIEFICFNKKNVFTRYLKSSKYVILNSFKRIMNLLAKTMTKFSIKFYVDILGL